MVYNRPTANDLSSKIRPFHDQARSAAGMATHPGREVLPWVLGAIQAKLVSKCQNKFQDFRSRRKSMINHG
jgi:hypothetical protein